MNRRVVITGLGAVTPLGNNVADFWENVKNGNVGIDFITRFDTTDFKVKIAAEVKNFQPDERYVQKKETKRMDLFCQYALCAAGEAMDDSGLDPAEVKANPRMGVIVGSGIGGLGTLEEQVIRLSQKGPGAVAPLFIPMAIGNMAAGNISIKYGMKGICSSIITACSSGNNSIGEAFRSIKHGYSDLIFAGGAEASITGIGIAGFTSITALSRNNDPKKASRPFDKDRDGFVMGEGSGILILEELERAQARGAKIYAEVVGYGANGDAYHMTSPDPNGEGACRAMQLAMEEAGVSPAQVGYINAHGTSTPPNDLPETKAIKLAMGDAAYDIPVSSSKSMFGHLLGAAGAVEAIVCVEALRHGFIPPTAGLENPEEGCDLNYVPQKGFPKDIQYALSNSFGFGGHNGVLCFKKWEG